MRKTFIILGVILVVFAIGLWLFLSNIDSMSKGAIEKYGSQITKVAVHVGDVKVSPKTGEGELTNLMISNPSGFNTPYAFSFANIAIKLDIASLTKPLVVINEISVNAPNVNVEQTANGNNIHIIQKNIQDFIAAHTDASSSKLFIIDALTIKNATLHVSAPLVKAEIVTIPLADIQLNNIGKDKNGVPAAVVLDMLMQQINVEIAKALTSRGLDNMVDLKSLGITTPTITERIRTFFNQL